jgi:hypothetical protein
LKKSSKKLLASFSARAAARGHRGCYRERHRKSFLLLFYKKEVLP